MEVSRLNSSRLSVFIESNSLSSRNSLSCRSCNQNYIFSHWLRLLYGLFQLLFNSFELLRLRVLFVERIEWITARDQPVARPRRAIAKCAAQSFCLHPGTVNHVERQIVIGQNHSPQPHKINLSGAHIKLSDVRKPILQVRVARSDDTHLRIARLQFAGDLDLARDANERVFRRFIAVGGREESGPLNMRVVIGAARRNADELDVQIVEQIEKLK